MTKQQIADGIRIAKREMATNPCPRYKARCAEHIEWLRSQAPTAK